MSSPARGPNDGPPLRVEVRRHVASSVVEISGEVDLATAPAVKKAFEGLFVAGERHVIVDLAGLEFIDMSGIHLLEEFANRWAGHHGRLGLRRPTRTVGRLLALLDQIAGARPRPWVCQDSPYSAPRSPQLPDLRRGGAIVGECQSRSRAWRGPRGRRFRGAVISTNSVFCRVCSAQPASAVARP